MTTTSTSLPLQPVAIVTGASRGLGRGIARALVAAGWSVTADARDGDRLAAALGDLPPGRVTTLAGDVTDPSHRRALVAAARAAGQLRLLINNASLLGPSPRPGLADFPVGSLRNVLETNVVAPLALLQLVLPDLSRSGGQVINVTSDAGSDAYAGWGGYGASKAALDQLTAVLALEHPDVRVHAFDPGDMLTDMHQLAFPGEDISDRPTVESVVPALLRLVQDGRPSGVYRASDLTGHQAVPA